MGLYKIGIMALFLIIPFFTFAQNIATSFNLNVSPANPAPGESVSVSVSSSQFNIDLANISWSLDGKVVSSGIGEKTFSLKAPVGGKTSVVLVTVTPSKGQSIEKSVNISSGDLDLIWESVDGYTPPFYRGKTLPIKQSVIKIVAIPDVRSSSGSNAKINDFVYSWRKDGSNMAGQSGLAKNSFQFANQILDQNNRIDVSATNGTKTVENSMIITPFTPEIVFYKFDQDKGMSALEKAFTDTVNVSNQPRYTIAAEPYFLKKNFLKDKNVTFTWKLNNQEAKAGVKNNLGIVTSNKGMISLQLNYDEGDKLFRAINGGLRIFVQ